MQVVTRSQSGRHKETAIFRDIIITWGITMKILQWLTAIIALMLALQVSASTVSPSHKSLNKSPVHGPHFSIADLFGSSEVGTIIPDITNAGSFEESQHRRYGQITRFGSVAGGPDFPRKAERLKEYLSEHGYEGDVFNRDHVPPVNPPIDTPAFYNGLVNTPAMMPASVPFHTLPGSGCGQAVVPVPAAVWLFGSGLLGLVGMARRKKAA